MLKENSITEEENMRFIDETREKYLRNLHPSIPTKPIYPLGTIPIHKYLTIRAFMNSNKDAIIYYGTKISYNRLNELSNKFAHYLISELKLPKGSVVGIILPNCPDFYIAYYGILKAGDVAALYSVMYRELEFRYLFKASNPNIIIVADNLYDTVRKITMEVNPNIKLICASDLDFLPSSPEIPIHPSMNRTRVNCEGSEDISDILNSSELPNHDPVMDYPERDVSLADPAVMLFTSGTTGLPKPVVHRHFNILYKQAAAYTYGPYDRLLPDKNEKIDYAKWLEEQSKDEKRIVVLPIYWVAGKDFGLDSLPVIGYTAIPIARYHPESILTAISKYRVTSIYMTFDQYIEVMNNPNIKNYDLTSLKFAAGSSFVTKLSRDLRRRFNEVFPNAVLYEAGYGMTETHTYDIINIGMSLNNLDLNLRERYGSLAVGPLVPGTYVKIVDTGTGNILPPGKPGIIWIKSPALVNGYLGRPEETARDFVGGWFNTGDYGLIDENGFLHFIQRVKDLIKVSGVSVSPSLIEDELKELIPEIKEVTVIGVKDEVTGEAPVAFVVLKEEYKGRITEEEMLSRCRNKMAKVHIPKRIIILDQLPKSSVGKVLKEELKRIWENMVHEK